MKWAYRLAVVGAVWAIVTFALFAPRDCATNDLCGFGFSILNLPISILPAGPSSGFPLLLEGILCDLTTGFLAGWIIDFVLFHPKTQRSVVQDSSEKANTPTSIEVDAVDKLVAENTTAKPLDKNVR
jgi:hypothetical protein